MSNIHSIVETFEENGLYGIKVDGKVICDPIFSKVGKGSYGFIRVERKGFHPYFLDYEGKPRFEEYADVKEFVNGFAGVKLFFDKWTFIDVNGKMISKETFYEVGDFFENCALVFDKKDGNIIAGRITSDGVVDWIK